MGIGGHNVRKKYCLKCQDHTLEYLVERICATLGYIYFPKMLKLMLLCGLFLAGVPYFLDWNARVLLVPSELLAGVVFEGAFYSRARSIPFSLSVTKFFSKHKKCIITLY